MVIIDEKPYNPLTVETAVEFVKSFSDQPFGASLPQICDAQITDCERFALRIVRKAFEDSVQYYVAPYVAWEYRESAKIVGQSHRGLAHRLRSILRTANVYTTKTFLHDSAEVPGMVAYTRNETDGMADKQIRCAPGKYLSACYPQLTSQQISDFVRRASPTARPFEVVTDVAAINEVFETRLGAEGEDRCSCMVGKFAHWNVRPYHIYADHDVLGVALQRNAEGAIVARSVVFRDTKQWIRPYATNCEARDEFVASLEAEGWTKFSTDDSRDLEVVHLARDGQVLCPYTDWKGAITTTEGVELETNNTNGYGADNLRCSSCSQHLDEDNAFPADGETLCESCYDDAYTRCSKCEDSVGRDATTTVDGEEWCGHCIRNYATECKRCGEYTHDDNISTVEDESWCDGCVFDHAGACHKCEDYFDTDNLTEHDHDYYCEDCRPEEDTEDTESTEATEAVCAN